MNAKQAKMLRKMKATRKEAAIYNQFPDSLKAAIRAQSNTKMAPIGLIGTMRSMQK